jgi:hypothetical protein
VPHSVRRRMISQRRKFTGETTEQAAPGVQGRSHGLDECSREQRRFRAVLAVLMLNEHTDHNLGQDTVARCIASSVLRQTIHLSARSDELVVLSDIPHHLIQKVLPRDVASTVHGIPGLRCLDADPEGRWYRFLHVGTGGMFRLQYAGPTPEEYCFRPEPDWPDSWNPVVPAPALTENEAHVLAQIPAMHEDLETLLAGLVVRLSCKDPDDRWALGELDWDPLRRRRPKAVTYRRYLWGSGTDWILHYNGPIPADDIAAALTDAHIGIAGARIAGRQDGLVRVERGRASLEISNYTAPYDRVRPFTPRTPPSRRRPAEDTLRT